MNQVHPTAVVGPGVELGDDNIVGPYAVIYGPTVIGDRNWIGPHVVIGTPGDSRGNAHPPLWDAPGSGQPIVIGNDNIFHEFATIHASVYDQTRVGSDCFLMDKAHVSHDVHLGDRVTLTSSVMLGGHCHIGDGTNLGLSTVVHQFTVIGPGAMIGMGSVVTKHIPPFAIAYGSPVRVQGANRIGMSRAGIADDVIDLVHADLTAGRVPSVSSPDLEPARSWFDANVAGAAR